MLPPNPPMLSQVAKIVLFFQPSSCGKRLNDYSKKCYGGRCICWVLDYYYPFVSIGTIALAVIFFKTDYNGPGALCVVIAVLSTAAGLKRCVVQAEVLELRAISTELGATVASEKAINVDLQSKLTALNQTLERGEKLLTGYQGVLKLIQDNVGAFHDDVTAFDRIEQGLEKTAQDYKVEDDKLGVIAKGLTTEFRGLNSAVTGMREAQVRLQVQNDELHRLEDTWEAKEHEGSHLLDENSQQTQALSKRYEDLVSKYAALESQYSTAIKQLSAVAQQSSAREQAALDGLDKQVEQEVAKLTAAGLDAVTHTAQQADASLTRIMERAKVIAAQKLGKPIAFSGAA